MTPKKVNPVDQNRINRFDYFVKKYVSKNQIEASEKLGIFQSGYSMILNGKKNISLKIQMKLRNDYLINLEWLNSGVGEERVAADAAKKQSPLAKIIELQVSVDAANRKIEIMEANLNHAFKMIETLKARVDAMQA